MAPPNATSSPRDDHVDANPDLARKKQRLSEDDNDNDNDPDPDDILVEACEPEDVGLSLQTAIEIEDDSIDIMESYSEDFRIRQEASPLDQINVLHREIASGKYYFPLDQFRSLARWIDRHVDDTRDVAPIELRRQYLEADADFFSALGKLAHATMSIGDLFEPTRDMDSESVKQSVFLLHVGFVRLSCRILVFLPDIIKNTLSRRDSAAQDTARSQSIDFLQYLGVIARALPTHAVMAIGFKKQTSFELRSLLNAVLEELRSSHVLQSIAAIATILGPSMRQVKESWLALQDAIRVATALIISTPSENLPFAEIEDIMGVINTCIVPAVCAKHPGALPAGFHPEIMSFGHRALLCCTRRCLDADDSASDIYLRLVKSEEDSLLTEDTQQQTMAQSLRMVSGDDKEALASMLALSWAMQTARSFLRSDIMDIRSIGLNLLGQHLQLLHGAAVRHVDKFDNVVMQYAVRFLRKNEVTKYIFSSDSHASLIAGSAQVITFLAASLTYTNQETDVIWHACSTSVEADFAKASFRILEQQLHFLDFSHLLYILQKYEATPIQTLGPDALHFLHVLLVKVEEVSCSTAEPASRISFAFTTIDILKHVDLAGDCATAQQARRMLHAAMAKIASHTYTSEDRRTVYSRYLPAIEERTVHATTAMQVLNVLFDFDIPLEDRQTISLMLPVSTAVDELRHFVSSAKGSSSNALTSYFVGIRLTCIVQLMSIETPESADDLEKTVFDHVFGESALSEAARGDAWDRLSHLTKLQAPPSAAVTLWRKYMQRYVPSLPWTLASAKLIELTWAYLADECTSSAIQSDFSNLLEHPLWQALVRFAVTSDNDAVAVRAVGVISNMLFGYAANTASEIPRHTVVKCHRNFVRTQIDLLCKSNATFKGSDTVEHVRQTLQTVHVLQQMLGKSKETAAYYAPTAEPEVLVIDKTDNAADCISFTVHVYSSEPQPKMLTVQASKAVTVSRLLSELVLKTGAQENRIIAGGCEITGQRERTLEEARFQNSGVIHVRPQYTQEFDFEQLSRNACPVEQEIVAHYNSLDAFLDGPLPVAGKALTILTSVRPTTEARRKVTSETSTATELFPSDRPIRAMFSVHVLECHLKDSACIGIADAGFLVRGARLLTAALMDPSRQVSDDFFMRIVTCLKLFLQERPSSDEALRYFEDGAAFCARAMDVLSEIQHSQMEPGFIVAPVVSQRTALVGEVYSMLLLACRVDDTVWQHFRQSEDTPSLHSRLLLDSDSTFSLGIGLPVKSLCQDSSTASDVPDFYWRIIIDGLTDALGTTSSSYVYFNLAADLLHHTKTIREDESGMRGLVEQLSTALWNYQHTEFVNDLLRDDTMHGLLALLREATSILKSFKKPLKLEGLSAKIFRELLFPDGELSRPLVHDDTRKVAFGLVRLALEFPKDFDDVIASAVTAMNITNRQSGAKYPGHADWLRSPGECSGLRNLGMTCYMNSMLQQLFGNVQFRKFILDLPVTYPDKQNILRQIQNLFAKMQDSLDLCQETWPLAEALGIVVGNQEDVHDFYASLLSRLEDEMPDTESKITLSKYFTGQSVTQIRGECGHVSAQKEAFSDLSVTVKNKANLHDSLAEFVQGEPMAGANKYKCLSCDPEHGRLVDAMRRTCLEDVPDCLTVCLKRFTYENKVFGEGKVNDRFEFPESVDMSLYKRSHLEAPDQPHEPDEFQLVGVIVHQGSLNFGHYWSYVRTPHPAVPGAGEWMYLEDNKAQRCTAGLEGVQQECFGGQLYTNGNERPDNAYVLFYQRKQYIAEASVVSEDVKPLQLHPGRPPVLPRASMREELAMDVLQYNTWKFRISALFHDRFANFMIWLLNQWPASMKTRRSGSDSGSSMDLSDDDVASPDSAEINVADAIVSYVLRVLLSQNSSEELLPQTMAALNAVLSTSPRIAQHILYFFSGDSFGFEMVHLHGSSKVRSAVFEFLKECLKLSLDQDRTVAGQTLRRLVQTHSSLMNSEVVDTKPLQWEEYFAFPAWVASLGAEETAMVLDAGYYMWPMEIFYMEHAPHWKQKHPSLYSHIHRNRNTPDFDPLFGFLHSVLYEHVDLGLSQQQPGPRTQSNYGIRLKANELECLMHLKGARPPRTWTMFDLATEYGCSKKSWRECNFGKLLGLLVSSKADPYYRRHIETTLLTRYQAEDRNLRLLLHTTLHFCANSDDDECPEILRVLSSNLVLWVERERECMAFLREAFTLVPCSVICAIPDWMTEFLVTAKNEQTRQAAAHWLKDHLFGPQPFTEHPRVHEARAANGEGKAASLKLDASRARIARTFVKTVGGHVKEAYDRELPKNVFEPAVSALEDAEGYLTVLLEVARKAMDEGVALPAEMIVEADESRTALTILGDLLAELRDWESEAVLPTILPSRTTGGIRQSVEIDDSDDAGYSDEDDDFGDDEELSQSM